MEIRQALQNAIKSPRDITARLIYADYLETEGDVEMASVERKSVERLVSRIASELQRSSFLLAALEAIEKSPYSCKGEIVAMIPYATYRGRMANQTRAYRYSALSKLIGAGLVANELPEDGSRRNGYSLVITDLGQAVLECIRTTATN